MNSPRLSLFLTILIACFFIISSCDLFSNKPQVDSYEFSDSLINIDQGSTAPLTLSVSPTNSVSKLSFNYSSSNSSIATVSGTGLTALVTGVSAGAAIITCSSPETGSTTTCAVTVNDVGVANGTITVDSTSITTPIGVPVVLNAKYNGGTAAQQKTLTWRSAVPTVGQLIGSGTSTVFMPAAIGSTVVSVSIPQTDANANIIVTVTSSITSLPYIKCSSPISQLIVGNSLLITASVSGGSPADTQALTWLSTDSTICTVEGSGGSALLSAISPGTCTLLINSPNYAPVSVKVIVSSAAASGITLLSTASSALNLISGINSTCNVTLDSSIAGFAAQTTWSTSNSSILQVYGSGTSVVLIPLSSGLATITVTNPKVPSPLNIYCSITGSAQGSSISVSSTTNLLQVTPGTQSTVNATLVNGAPGQDQGITWTSSDPSIVSVFGGGPVAILTANAIGTAHVVLSSPLTASSFTIYVNVSATASGNFTISTANTLQQLVTGIPQVVTVTTSTNTPASYNSLTYTSSDPTKMIVVGAGKSVLLKPLAAGTVTLTVNSPNASYPLQLVCDISSSGGTQTITPSTTIQQMSVGTTKILSAGITSGVLADLNSLVWTSSDPTIVSLIGNGESCLLTANKIGIAQITISSEQAPSATIYVQVSGSGITYYLSTSTTIVNLTAGQNQAVMATLQNGTSIDQSGITWTPADPSICSVFGSGNTVQLQPKTAGQTYITISSPKAAQSINMYINVSAIAADAIFLTCDSSYVDLLPNAKQTLNATLNGGNTTDQGLIKWQSSNTSVFTILGSGSSAKLTAVGVGNAQLIITNPISSNTLYIPVSVSTSQEIITLNKSNIALLIGGGSPTATLNASITNSQQSDYAAIVWTVNTPDSNNPCVAIIGAGASITVSALNAGSGSIIASLPNGSFAVCYYTVSYNYQLYFTDDASGDYLEPGSTSNHGLFVLPSNSNITVLSSNPEIATGSFSFGSGSINITAGNIEGTCTITISANGLDLYLPVTVKWKHTFSITGLPSILGAPAMANGQIIPYSVSAKIHPSMDSASLTFSGYDSSIIGTIIWEPDSLGSELGKLVITPASAASVGTGTIKITDVNASISQNISYNLNYSPSISVPQSSYSIYVGDAATAVPITYFPSVGSLSVSSSNSSVDASIGGQSVLLSSTNAGSSNITVTVTIGSNSKSYSFNVTSQYHSSFVITNSDGTPASGIDGSTPLVLPPGQGSLSIAVFNFTYYKYKAGIPDNTVTVVGDQSKIAATVNTLTNGTGTITIAANIPDAALQTLTFTCEGIQHTLTFDIKPQYALSDFTNAVTATASSPQDVNLSLYPIFANTDELISPMANPVTANSSWFIIPLSYSPAMLDVATGLAKVPTITSTGTVISSISWQPYGHDYGDGVPASKLQGTHGEQGYLHFRLTGEGTGTIIISYGDAGNAAKITYHIVSDYGDDPRPWLNMAVSGGQGTVTKASNTQYTSNIRLTGSGNMQSSGSPGSGTVTGGGQTTVASYYGTLNLKGVMAFGMEPVFSNVTTDFTESTTSFSGGSYCYKNEYYYNGAHYPVTWYSTSNYGGNSTTMSLLYKGKYWLIAISNTGSIY